MQVQRRRLREDLLTNATFGAVNVEEGHGRTVLTGTDADRRAREYFVDRLEERNLEVRVDPVGNIAGRWVPDSADPMTAPVALGSHLDSVPNGGIFDGPLGVYAALESVRALQDAEVPLERPIDVVCFTGEEGQRFDYGALGSAVAVGDVSTEWALTREDDEGVSLEEALQRIGFSGSDTINPETWDSWLELHIEQAETLINKGAQAGIISAITGITRCEASIEGEANHAGTTSMRDRTDALTAASEFVLDIERAASERLAVDSSAPVATVGHSVVSPNAPNVVPGAVTLTVDVRDTNYSTMEYLVDRAKTSLARLESERGVKTSFNRSADRPPQTMNERCRIALQDAATNHDIPVVELESRAAHDTMRVAKVTDASMLFAPSHDGLSHTPLEWTDWDDCVAATQILTGAIETLAEAE
ncbi:Zn-dependent hydrolase [Natronolimnobius baerhuensis]|uniref:Zn-dependent hydrolase n=1 Tax=Natronolimnobius baerhuensis TaxID=253108 RepID=A0A202E3H4_9EURY|nr:Zn-dependent hydrolase [Natronolimnobius baerhuensis]OVE82843.1 Zn-dependent hydrolase [Natronolimnobius baerhuensis]